VPLTQKILENIRNETGRSIHIITDESLDLLMGYRWPGNIRQLINVLQFASVRTESDRIEPRHLPPELRAPQAPQAGTPATPVRRRQKLTLASVEQALASTGGNKVQAAKVLGVGRATLYRFLDKQHVS
jgi:transcriptional regulator of acetoin/glycerol metabolism